MVKTNHEEAFYDDMLAYRDDPIGFMVDVLDVKPEHVWPKMREVAESVKNYQFTAVPAGHSVSKTYNAARIALWFKTCFQPSTVITTAPSDNQVRNQLWREIHAAYAGGKVPLGGKMTTLQWNVKPDNSILSSLPPDKRGDWQKNFAIGFSTSPDTVSEHCTKMQGWHNDWVLIILDEFGGLMPLIFRTVMQSLVINERVKILGIGNPTDPYGDFANVCKPGSGWNVIPVSVRDTPNYVANQELIPGLAGRDFEARIVQEYGENSNEHKCRCLGQFPLFAEGAIWGPEIADFERQSYFGDYPWDPTAFVYTIGDYGNIYTAIGFFQFLHGSIRMIDYFYDDVGMGIPAICKIWDNMPYNFAKHQGHWAGPDMDPEQGSNRKSLATGRTLIDEFKRLGYQMLTCQSHDFDAGVKVARSIFPLLRADRKCKDWLDAIKQYKFKKNIRYSTEDKPAYSTDPEPTPSRHPADMLRHLAWIYRNQLVIDGQRLGIPKAKGYSYTPQDLGQETEVMRV